MMVNTEHTPNPDTLKFLPGKKVSEVGPLEFLKNDQFLTKFSKFERGLFFNFFIAFFIILCSFKAS